MGFPYSVKSKSCMENKDIYYSMYIESVFIIFFSLSKLDNILGIIINFNNGN